MRQIPDGSIDMILCDPPYGTTPYSWDKELDFQQLWLQYKRIAKKNAAILLFGQEPFSSMVRLSNLKNYRYDWFWEKERLTNIFQVKRRPGKTIENIMVFYEKQCNYYPQKKLHLGKKVTNKIGKHAKIPEIISGNRSIRPAEYIDDGTRHPTQLLKFNRDKEKLHKMQKPVALLEFLIKTYTKEGEIVLDNCMGSGSTIVACINQGRSYIGIENQEKFFRIAQHRINPK
jgi:site-specific DNA-methyltransferase (adenine-specific)